MKKLGLNWLASWDMSTAAAKMALARLEGEQERQPEQPEQAAVTRQAGRRGAGQVKVERCAANHVRVR